MCSNQCIRPPGPIGLTGNRTCNRSSHFIWSNMFLTRANFIDSARSRTKPMTRKSLTQNLYHTYLTFHATHIRIYELTICCPTHWSRNCCKHASRKDADTLKKLHTCAGKKFRRILEILVLEGLEPSSL